MRALHYAMMGTVLVVGMVLSLGVVQPAAMSAWAQPGHAVVEYGHEAVEPHGTAQHGQHGTAQHGQHGTAQAGQHGDMNDPEAHFHAVAEHLGLTAEQQDTLAEPFAEAFAVMQRLHELHAAIEAELTAEQKATLAEMVHEMMAHTVGGASGGQ